MITQSILANVSRPSPCRLPIECLILQWWCYHVTHHAHPIVVMYSIVRGFANVFYISNCKKWCWIRFVIQTKLTDLMQQFAISWALSRKSFIFLFTLLVSLFMRWKCNAFTLCEFCPDLDQSGGCGLWPQWPACKQRAILLLFMVWILYKNLGHQTFNSVPFSPPV